MVVLLAWTVKMDTVFIMDSVYKIHARVLTDRNIWVINVYLMVNHVPSVILDTVFIMDSVYKILARVLTDKNIRVINVYLIVNHVDGVIVDIIWKIYPMVHDNVPQMFVHVQTGLVRVRQAQVQVLVRVMEVQSVQVVIQVIFLVQTAVLKKSIQVIYVAQTTLVINVKVVVMIFLQGRGIIVRILVNGVVLL